MALLALLDLEGVEVKEAYWRLSALNWVINEPLSVRLEISGYASKAAFDAGKNPLMTRQMTADLTNDEGHPDAAKVEMLIRVRSLAYMEIKRFPEMEGALDV
jgi:hypothetical protein